MTDPTPTVDWLCPDCGACLHGTTSGHTANCIYRPTPPTRNEDQCQPA